MAIDRRKLLETLWAGPSDGMQAADITRALDLPRDRRAQIRRLLKELCRAGLVVQRGRLFSPGEEAQERLQEEERARDANLLDGMLKVTPAGHAYVDLEDAAYAGILVEAADFGSAIDGDRVAVEVTSSHKGRRHGRVVEVRERGRKRIVGTLEGPPWRLAIDDRRLASQPISLVADIAADIRAEAEQGPRLTVCAIERYPEEPGAPLMVRPQVVLGPPGLLSAEVERVLWEIGIPQEWDETIRDETAKMPNAVREQDLEARADRRDLPFVTIDPETAKDFDDAVCARRREDGTIEVWVAVADVSHYVREDSAIDVEARMRGCSVYLPGRAIPMLPDALSSHLCSLVPDEDRLAMVVHFELGLDGAVSAERAESAVIRSRARLDYPGVAAALAGDFRGLRSRYEPHVEQLALLAEGAERLRRRRRRRGSLTALDLPEAKVVLDEDDPERVRDIVAARAEEGERSAYGLIEELMIAANEAVARLFIAADSPTIFRVHGEPRAEALERLVTQLGAYGMYVELPQLFEPQGMNQLLQAISGHPAARPLAYLVLRTLAQAEYHVENKGHFGLASEGYLHFTSPIRRYPDLHVHRLLKQLLRKQGKTEIAGAALTDQGEHWLRQTGASQLRTLSRESSECERRAMAVERQMVALYAAALLADRVGDAFDGTVINFSSSGVFIGLDHPHVEGMVRIDSLPGHVDVDHELMRLEGQRGAPSLRLGDRVRARVSNTSLAKRQVDLELESGGALGMARKRRFTRDDAQSAEAGEGEGQRRWFDPVHGRRSKGGLAGRLRRVPARKGRGGKGGKGGGRGGKRGRR